MDILGCHPQQHLTGTAKLTELAENKPDDLLQSAVRIKAEANMTIPNVACRSRDSQLSAFGFRSCRLVHTRTNDAQFELADTPLHAKQQAIVRTAWIVDTIVINHTRLDQSA